MYFCSIDQGTSSTRAIVFDMDEATVVADHQIEFKSEYPKPGYAQVSFAPASQVGRTGSDGYLEHSKGVCD